MRTAVDACTGTEGCWGDSSPFGSGDTVETRSINVIHLELPEISEASAQSLSSLQVSVKTRGPDGGWIKWVWEVQNQATKEWVKLGDNTVIPSSQSWTWVTLDFAPLAGPASQYLLKTGTTYSVLVRQTCETLRADTTNIEFMRARLSSPTPINIVLATPTPSPTTALASSSTSTESNSMFIDAFPASLTTESGEVILPSKGIAAMQEIVDACTGTEGCWSEAVQFLSGNTTATRSSTIIGLQLPSVFDSTAQTFSDLAFFVKMRGPHGAWITWAWEVQDQASGQWVKLGDTAAVPLSQSWTWVPLTFSLAGPASPFLKKVGSTYSVLVRQTCITLKADAINIEYMRIRFRAPSGAVTLTAQPSKLESQSVRVNYQTLKFFNNAHAFAQGTVSGSSKGVVALQTAGACNGSADNGCWWSDSVQFTSGNTTTTASVTFFTLDLPAMSDAAAQNLTSLELHLKMLGPSGDWIKWTWAIQNQATGEWVALGDNTVLQNAQAWTWTALTFPAPRLSVSQFIKKIGSTHSIILRQTCDTPRADSLFLDYINIRVQSPSPVSGAPATQPVSGATTPRYNVDALPTRITSQSGTVKVPASTDGVPAIRAGSPDCNDTQGCWTEIVQFYSGATSEARSITVFQLELPAMSESSAQGLSSPRLSIKLRGPDGAWITWMWEIQNQVTGQWVKLGDNNAVSSSQAWKWMALDFDPVPGAAAPYLLKTGSTYSVLVRQSCLTLKADGIFIDSMRVSFASEAPVASGETFRASVTGLPAAMTAKTGVSVLRKAAGACTGKQDCWSDYVAFTTGDTSATVSTTDIQFDLPEVSEAAIQSLSSLQFSVKLRGADGTWLRWSWAALNHSTGEWTSLGDNAAVTPSQAWTWTSLDFDPLPGVALPYLKKTGATYSVTIRQTCLTLTEVFAAPRNDTIAVDFMRIGFQSSLPFSTIYCVAPTASNGAGSTPEAVDPTSTPRDTDLPARALVFQSDTVGAPDSYSGARMNLWNFWMSFDAIHLPLSSDEADALEVLLKDPCTGRPKYSVIVFASGASVLELSSAQLKRVEAYERLYRVRRVVFSSNPSIVFSFVGGVQASTVEKSEGSRRVDATPAALGAKALSSGAGMLSTGNLSHYIVNVASYDASTFLPFMFYEGQTGQPAAGVVKLPDGRQEMHFFFSTTEVAFGDFGNHFLSSYVANLWCDV
eukprot:tig00000076_g2435.t1